MPRKTAKPTTDECGGLSPAALQRFWEKVDTNGPQPESRPDLGNCWLWTAAVDSGGYGAAYNGERVVGAHRLSYEWHYGPITNAELVTDHLCRVRRCVRPTHLELVTHTVNTQRGISAAPDSPGALASREWHSARTHCKRGHPYSGDNLGLTKDGTRFCRACIRATRATSP